MELGIQINLDQTSCIRCKTCISTCYQNVYKYNKVKNEVYVAYPQDCVSCLMCAMNCPKDCIEIVPLPVHKFDPLVGE